MTKNKTFGNHGGNHTPFHRVHLAKSSEIVNELSSPICSVEIDDVPQAVQRGNAAVIIRCLNAHDALVGAVKAGQQVVKLLLAAIEQGKTGSLDAEHLPFQRAAIDALVLAGGEQ